MTQDKPPVIDSTNYQSTHERSFFVTLVYWIIYFRIKIQSPKDALRFLLLLDRKLYFLQGDAAVRYGDGIHTKHHHMHYHDFFVNRISKNEKVLDVGCGTGTVAYAVAQTTGAMVTGIDLDPKKIEKSRTEYSFDNTLFIVGDVLTDIPHEKFDVIILSNVLEHIEKRTDFLIHMCSQVSPKRLLLRVPLFERDWRVPLKEELGIDYRLDNTHYVEYTYDSFIREMKDARLKITYLQSVWGEIWAEVVPDDT